MYDIPARNPLPALGVAAGVKPPDVKRSGYLQTIEGNRWIVTLVGRLGDYPPNTPAQFVEFAKNLTTPIIYDTIRSLRPIAPIAKYRFPNSLVRHYDQHDDFPEGLLVIGDALCSLNPVYGQGMSVAAQQTATLATVLGDIAAGDAGVKELSRRFFAGAAQVIRSPWEQALETDLAFEETVGQRPSRFERRRTYTAALKKLGRQDPDVQRLLFEVSHLTRSNSALVDDELRRRAYRLMTA